MSIMNNILNQTRQKSSNKETIINTDMITYKLKNRINKPTKRNMLGTTMVGKSRSGKYLRYPYI